MNSLPAFSAFVRTVELGSLSAVAREEGVSQPTISKRIVTLERSLGVRLLERNTTRLSLTEQGQRLFDRIKRLVDDHVDLVAEAQSLDRQPAGRVRVNAPLGLGEVWLNAILLDCQARHPQLEIELMLDDRVADLIDERIDIALRLGADLPPEGIARKIGTSPRILVASPDYLATSAPLSSPDDLMHHRVHVFPSRSSEGGLRLWGPGGAVSVPVEPGYRVNNSVLIRRNVESGTGVALLPYWLTAASIEGGRLVRVLPAWRGPSQDLHFVSPSRRRQVRRVQVVVQHILDCLDQLPGLHVEGDLHSA